MLVRSWNLYHGMTSPRGRRSHLEEAVRLVSSDRPDVVCLQEVPLWGCPHLEDWSGMTAIWRSTRRVWFPPRLGGRITRLNQGFFRSAFSGQANAILLRPRLVPLEERWTVVSRGRRERLAGVQGEYSGAGLPAHAAGDVGRAGLAVADPIQRLAGERPGEQPAAGDAAGGEGAAHPQQRAAGAPAAALTWHDAPPSGRARPPRRRPGRPT